MTVKILDFADKFKAAQYIPVASTIVAPAFAGAGVVAAIEQLARLIFHKCAELFFHLKKNPEAKARHFAMANEASRNLVRSLQLIMRALLGILPIIGNLSVYALDLKKDNKKQATQVTSLTQQNTALEEQVRVREERVQVLGAEKDQLKKDLDENKKEVIKLQKLVQNQSESLLENEKRLKDNEKSKNENNQIINRINKQKDDLQQEVNNLKKEISKLKPKQ